MFSIADLLKFNEKFVKDSVKKTGKVSLMVTAMKDNNLIVFPCTNRNTIKESMELAKKLNAEWIVVIFECYKMKVKAKIPPKDYEHGELEKKFKSGDKSVEDSVLIAVYTRDEKRLVTYTKVDNKLKDRLESKEFGGFLSFEDEENTFGIGG